MKKKSNGTKDSLNLKEFHKWLRTYPGDYLYVNNREAGFRYVRFSVLEYGETNEMENNLQIIWDALHGYREDCIPEKAEEEHYDEEWDDICTAMTHIHKALGLESPLDHWLELDTKRKDIE